MSEQTAWIGIDELDSMEGEGLVVSRYYVDQGMGHGHYRYAIHDRSDVKPYGTVCFFHMPVIPDKFKDAIK